MKFLMFSQSGEGSQILARIEQEGNEVGLYIKDEIYKTVFDGILPKVEKPDNFIDKDTIIIFDISGNGDVADRYRRSGHKVYGSSKFADNLEHDRQFGFDVMKRCGIKIPEFKEFQNFNEGISYIQESQKRLVFKPNGSMPCKLTYCAGKENPTDELMSYIKFVEKKFGKDIDSFILQDFIEGSVISSEFFCDGKDFVWPPNHTVEVKKSMNDELGPSTGCSGNITWMCDFDRIIKEGVFKVQDICRENQYIGQMDLNAVVNEEGVYGLEWTPRFGYDATPTFLTLLKGDFGEFFSMISSGDLDEINLNKNYAGAIRVTIPPYPAEPKEGQDLEKFSPNKGVPIQNYENYISDLYFYEVCIEDDVLQHSGGTGVIACGLGIADTPEKSLEKPIKILENLIIPDKQYRTDLHKVLPEMVKESMNYAS